MPVRINRPGADSAHVQLAPGPVQPDPDPHQLAPGPVQPSPERAAYRPPTPTSATTANATITIPDPMFTHRRPRASNLERSIETTALRPSHQSAEPRNTPSTRLTAANGSGCVDPKPSAAKT